MTSSETPHNRSEHAGFGAALRAARTASRLSLADLERRTKIRTVHLSALEEERLDLLPPLPFVRGFIRTYAQEVGLDPEPLVARLAPMAAERPGPTDEEWRAVQAPLEPAQPGSQLRRTASAAGVVALLIGIASVLFFAQQLRELGRPVQVSPPQPAATAPAPEPAPAPGAEPPPVPPPARVEGITVEITASGRSWLLVVADEQSLFTGFINPGESRRWQSAGAMTIRAGNAGAVVVTVNGKTVGPLGRPGEVVSRTFRKDAIP